jgi:hypothetical protein
MYTDETSVMRRSRPQHYQAADLRAIAYGESIDLRDWLSAAPARPVVPAIAPGAAGEPGSTGPAPWDLTLPAGLDNLPPVQTFGESLRGLVMREVIEPSVFRRFFGGSSSPVQAI